LSLDYRMDAWEKGVFFPKTLFLPPSHDGF
jgi:hypothetical protein